MDGEISAGYAGHAIAAVKIGQRSIGVERSDAELCGERAPVFTDRKIGAAEAGADDDAITGRVDLSQCVRAGGIDRVEEVLDGLSAAGVDGISLAVVLNL